MRLYRGQKRGDPVGEWWTSSKDVARDYAVPHGDWEILTVTIDRRNLAAVKEFSRTIRSGNRLRVVKEYRIPLHTLREFALAVWVVEGVVRIPITPRPTRRLDGDHSRPLVSEGNPS